MYHHPAPYAPVPDHWGQRLTGASVPPRLRLDSAIITHHNGQSETVTPGHPKSQAIRTTETIAVRSIVIQLSVLSPTGRRSAIRLPAPLFITGPVVAVTPAVAMHQQYLADLLYSCSFSPQDMLDPICRDIALEMSRNVLAAGQS